MSTSTNPSTKPTRKQLTFLRALAHQTGTTFTHPATRHQASREIAALLARPLSPRSELDLDRASVCGGDLFDEAA